MGEDIYGNPRNDWDVGAVEYGVGATDTTAFISFTPVNWCGIEIRIYCNFSNNWH